MSDAGNVDDPGFIYDAGRTLARLAGYGWDEINGWLSDRTDEAKSYGYGDDEIAAATGRQSPDAHAAALLSIARVNGASDPTQFDPLKTATDPAVTPLEAPAAERIATAAGVVPPAPQMPQEGHEATTPIDFNNAVVRGAYADALRTGAVQTPAQFSERYAGAYLDAASEQLPELTGSAHAAVVRAAGNLAASLPTDEDLTDTAIAVAHGAGVALTPDGVATVKNNLADDWVATNKPLQELYQKAQTDPDYEAKLTAPPEPPAPAWYKQFGAGFGDMLSGATELIEKAAPGVLHGPGATMTEYGGIDALQESLQPNAELPDDFFAKQAQQRLLDLKAEGYPDDSIARTAGQIAATIPLTTTFGLSGVWGWMAAGASSSAAITAFTPSTAEDYWTEKAKEVALSGIGGAAGGAVLAGGFKLFGKLISKMAPDVADHLAYMIQHAVEPRVPVSDPALPPGTPPRMVPASEAFAPVEPAKLYGETKLGAGEAKTTSFGGYTHYPIMSGENQIGHTNITFLEGGKVAAIDNIELTGGYEEGQNGLAGANKLGPRQVRDLARQLFTENPDLQTITGYRITGARSGSPEIVEISRDQVLRTPAEERPSAGMHFAEDATPAAKIERIAQDATGPGFTTSKGSTYQIHEDGTTTRFKSYHPEHGEADQGLQPRSENTFYVSEEDANKLGEFQVPGVKKAITEWKDGFWGVKYLEGKDAGKFERRTMIKPSQTPEVGAIPVEIFNDGERVHFGNPIVSLGREIKATPTFFEDATKAAGVTDPETIALAKGHDAAAGYASWLKSVFSDIMTDESGKIRLFPEQPPLAPSEERGAVIAMKNAASSTIAEVANGMTTQTINHITQQWEPLRKLFAPHMREWEAALQKIYDASGLIEKRAAVDAARNTEVGRYIMAVEGHGTLDPSSQLAPALAMRKGIRDITDGELRQALANGELNSLQWREAYFPHLYTGRRGLATSRGGSVGFTRMRTYDDIFDALMEGHQLKYPHPIDTDIAGDTAKLNTLSTLRIQKFSLDKSRNWMGYSTSPTEPPEPGWRRLVGLMSEKTAIDNRGIATGPTQYLWAPPGYAKIYNAHIGYQDYTTASTTFKNFEDALMRVKNLSTHVKLLLPLYHAVAEYKEGMAAAWGNSLIEMVGGAKHGDLPEVLRGIRDAVLAPVKPIQYVFQGGTKWRPMYRAAEQDPALGALNPQLRAMQAFVAGGGNIAGRGREYTESPFNTLVRDWQRGELGNSFMRDIRSVDSAWGLAKFPFRELSRLTTSASAPIWDHYIPLLKGGAAMEKIQTYLRQNPTANEEMVKSYARQVVLQIEDRFGEYNMNNLFWRPALRRVANQAMLSTSWTYGTLHSLATALGWNPGRGVEWNPVATADLMGHLASIAFTNAAWTYAATGHLPDNKLDYMIPFANARGITRVLLPGQEKEFYDFAKIAAESFSAFQDGGPWAGVHQFLQSSFNYGFGKLAPIYQAAYDLFNRAGEDAIGHKISWTPGGFMDWARSEFLPIFLQNWDKAKAAGISTTENLFGVREAPKWFADFNAWRAQQIKLHGRWMKAEVQRAGKEALAAGIEPPAGYRMPKVTGYRTPKATDAVFSLSPNSLQAPTTTRVNAALREPRETLQQRAERSLQTAEPISERTARATRAAQYARSTDPYHQALVTVLNSRQDREAQQQRPYRGNSAELIVNGVPQQQPRPARHRAAVSRSIASLLLRSELRRRAALAYYRRQRAIGGGAQGIGAGYQGVNP